jgi:hypothetical protein
MVMAMTLVGFVVVVNAVEESRIEPQHFESTEGVLNKHKTIGLVVFILTFIQAVGGAVRPHLPRKDDNGNVIEAKSPLRMLWEFVHKISGYALLAMAWYQCHSGLLLYSQIFVADETYTDVFWGILGAIGGIAFVGTLSRTIYPSQEVPQAYRFRRAVVSCYKCKKSP